MKKRTWIPVNKTEEVTEVNEVTTEEIAEEEQEEKEMGFFKKHWKKIALGAGIALAGVGGFILGSRDSNSNTEELADLCFEEVDPDEVPFDQDESEDSPLF